MKQGIILFLFMAIAGSGFAEDKKPTPQACADEEVMAADYQKGLTEFIGTVHKEKLYEFERAYHRRTCLSKLNLCDGILDVVTACYDEALKNTSAPKANLDTYHAKRDAYAKLKEKLMHYRDSLKAKGEDKDAKSLIETFDLTN